MTCCAKKKGRGIVIVFSGPRNVNVLIPFSVTICPTTHSEIQKLIIFKHVGGDF